MRLAKETRHVGLRDPLQVCARRPTPEVHTGGREPPLSFSRRAARRRLHRRLLAREEDLAPKEGASSVDAPQVTDAAVKSLADALDPDEPAEAEGRLPSLTLLDLSHNQFVTRAEAAILQRRCGKAVRVDAARLRD